MSFITALLKNPYFYTFFISMLPIVELRVGLPAGMTMGLSFWEAYPISVIGNILPVPFLILFSQQAVSFLAKKHICGDFFGKLIRKADEKSKTLGKYELLGLFLFVAVPLPGTGAWTGSLIAAVLRLRVLPAFIAITLGVMGAGVIMGTLSYGLLGALGALF
ncbi:MAG: small multi-drug export protein [Angelakisella sp.]